MYESLSKSCMIEILSVSECAIATKNEEDLRVLFAHVQKLLPYQQLVYLLARVDAKGDYLSTEYISGMPYDNSDQMYTMGMSHLPNDPVFQQHFGHFTLQSSAISQLSQIGNKGYTFGNVSENWSLGSLFSICGNFAGQESKYEPMISLLSPYLHLALLRYYFYSKKADAPRLTGRENEVLIWIKEGKTNWEISQILKISERTVKYHVENIYRKLGVSTRTRAVSVAVSTGVIYAA